MTKFTDKTTMNEAIPFIKESIRDGGQFVLFPKGTSMNPTIVQGEDCVILTELCDVSVHDIVLYRRKSGQYVLHRIMKAKNGNYIMCGDNQTKLEKGITDENLIALVTQIRKGDGSVLTHSMIREIGKSMSSIPKRIFKRLAAKVKRRLKK